MYVSVIYKGWIDGEGGRAMGRIQEEWRDVGRGEVRMGLPVNEDGRRREKGDVERER